MGMMAAPPSWLRSFNALDAELRGVEHWSLLNAYDDESLEGIGGFRAVHSSGFVMDILWHVTAPQALLWVNTPLESDRGEAHTLEHVLLGKGARGRGVASRAELCLAQSTAFTGRLRTCYTYQCPGRESFFTLFGAKLTALLAPDASDVEIARETCHFGPTDGCAVEELGTVYAEQRAAFQQANYCAYHALNKLLYGPGHPLAHEAGGTPQGIRAGCPEHLRAFHNSRYVLKHMGAVVALAPCCPRELLMRLHACIAAALDTPLTWLSDAAADVSCPAAELEERWLPPPEPAPAGTLRIVRVPLGDASAPGQLVAAWPSVMPLVAGPESSIALSLLNLLVHLVANGRTSELHATLVSGGSLGATGVSGYVSSEPGRAVFVTLDGLPRAVAAEDGTHPYAAACEAMRAAFARVAALADGSPALEAFNARALSHLKTMERSSRQFLAAPPRFGVRGVHAEWLDHLCDAQRCSQPEAMTISLSFVAEAAALRALLCSPRNEWAPHIAAWGLAARLPVAVASQACDAFAAQLEREKADRLQAFYDHIESTGLECEADDRRAAALARFRRAYDADTEASKTETAVFDPPSDLPMAEDELDASQLVLPGGGRLFAARFLNMTGGHAGVAFSLAGLPPRLLRALVGIAPLLKSCGVTTRRGVFVDYRQLCTHLQDEVLYLDARLSASRSSGRVELIFRTAGLTLAEAHAGLAWLEALVTAPDLTPRSLERLREAVDAAFCSARSLTERRAEFWQDTVAVSCLQAVTAPFLLIENHAARMHALLRLCWRLKAVPAEKSAAASCLRSLSELPSQGHARTVLEAALAAAESGAFPPGCHTLRSAFEAASPNIQAVLRAACVALRTMLPGVPDVSFVHDWKALCSELAADLLDPPEAALSELAEVLRFACRRGRARAYLAAAPEQQPELCAALRALVARLPAEALPSHGENITAVALRRAALRGAAVKAGSPPPCAVAIILPRLSVGGVVCMTACASAHTLDDDLLLDALAAQTVTGGGAHSLFMRLWSKGVAYSCGISVALTDGRLRFYADTCPDAARCLAAAAAEVTQDARAPAELWRAEYALAQCFTSRAGTSTPEARTEAAASDEADGRGDSRVRALRAALLRLRSRSMLGEELHRRAARVLGAVLPGVLPQPWSSNIGWSGAPSAPGTTLVVVGPEAQAAGVEAMLDAGPLLRLYERDFWLLAAEDVDRRQTAELAPGLGARAGVAVAAAACAAALVWAAIGHRTRA